MDCSFTYYGLAVPKGRPRFGKGRTFTPARTVSFEGQIKAIAKDEMARQGHKPTPDVCSAILTFERKMPKSWSRKRQDQMRGAMIAGHPDIDNQAKAILDALNGVTFEDDRQVGHLSVTRFWGEQDRVAVRVSTEPQQ